MYDGMKAISIKGRLSGGFCVSGTNILHLGVKNTDGKYRNSRQLNCLCGACLIIAPNLDLDSCDERILRIKTDRIYKAELSKTVEKWKIIVYNSLVYI